MAEATTAVAEAPAAFTGVILGDMDVVATGLRALGTVEVA